MAKRPPSDGRAGAVVSYVCCLFVAAGAAIAAGGKRLAADFGGLGRRREGEQTKQGRKYDLLHFDLR